MGLLDFFRGSHDPQAPPTPQPQHAAKPEADSEPVAVLRTALDSLRRAILAEHHRLSELPKENREIIEAIEKRREFVREQHLDSILCWLLRETWHYPAWSKRPDAAAHITLPVSDISGEDATRGKVIRFSLDGTPCQLTLTELPHAGPIDGDSTYATLVLSNPDDGTPWLSLRVRRALGDEYFMWHAAGVEAFRPGEWVLKLAHVYHTIEYARERDLMSDLNGTSRLDELRDSFGL